ncbi:MAG: L,D-transpeptidase [Xanthobacteraceae bacterium]|nr:L,D-transpeptidase [Xanthobacteraceae bacterium]
MSTHHGSPRDPSSHGFAFPGFPSSFNRIVSLFRLRQLVVVGLGSALIAFAGAAQAAVEITIDKNTQQMTVAVDGVARYNWPVSSGVPSRETPNGTFRAFRMEADHYSKEWDDAPMPHSIFFTKVGHAIHGTDSVGRLGSPASHGCVRLSREHAATLYALVEEQGVLNTTVTLTGSAQAALSRGTGRTQMARGDGAGDPTQLAPGGDGVQPGSSSGRSNGFFGAGNSVDPDQQNVVYVDRYGRPLDVFVTPDGRRVYRLHRQQPQYNQVDAYGRPYQPRGLFDQ